MLTEITNFLGCSREYKLKHEEAQPRTFHVTVAEDGFTLREGTLGVSGGSVSMKSNTFFSSA